jgi:2-polyprenyl-6-methoxyphenol hydroxylase-like FAD-dependent oxidoreductase
VSDETSVIIAGAGPVGTTLAMDLARLGVPSLLLERRAAIPPNPRCNTTNARSMELFRRLGCADAVRGAGLPADFNTDIVYLTRLNGTEITRFERSTSADVRSGKQHGVAANWPTPEPQHFLSQIYLEPVLRAHAIERWHVDLRSGWELESFTQDESGVSVVATSPETGAERTLRGRYLVGCDGSGSRVRKAIGSRLDGIPRLNDVCSTYFRSKRIAELAGSVPGWMLRFVSGGILVAIDGDQEWLLHLNVPGGEDPSTWEPEAAMFAAIGEPFDYEIIDRSRWTPRAMLATKWRERNVFLAGDAAHVWVPMGGFGMNAGIADATSLSWRLAAALDGWGGDGLLDSYETERAPIGDAIAGQAATWALTNGALMVGAQGGLDVLEADTDAGVAARAALDAQLRCDMLSEFECPGFQLGFVYRSSPVVAYDSLTQEPEPMVVEFAATSWPGSRLPHVWLGDGASIYDRLGTGFTLLRVGVDAPSGDTIVAAASSADAPLSVVVVDRVDVADAWDGVPLILLRPDQHVAWRSRVDPTPDEARAIVATVTGRLVTTAAPTMVDATPTARPSVDVSDSVLSPDGQIRYRVCDDGSGVEQRRVHADGVAGARRPFLDHPVVGGIAVDASGGLWAVDRTTATITRYDGAARPTHVARVPDDAEIIGCVTDGDRVLILSAGKAWEVSI